MSKKWYDPETVWKSPGLHKLSELKWVKGSGTFEGCDIAVVGENRETGQIAQYLKVPAGPQDERYHYHPKTSHSLIVDGSLTYRNVDGKIVTLETGDYFRCPGNWIHTRFSTDKGALIFMMMERAVMPTATYDTIFVDKQAALVIGKTQKEALSMSKKWHDPETVWERPGLHKLSELKWVKGSGTFEGCDIAVVGENLYAGKIAQYLKVPPHRQERYHYHPSTSHSLVIQGSVGAGGVDGKIVTLETGGYFRCPRNWIHSGTFVYKEATIFTVIEPEVMPRARFDTVLVDV